MTKKILTLILLMSPLIIKAQCQSETLSENKQLASNINSYYDYNEETKTFNATIYNISPNIYLYMDNQEYYPNPETKEIYFQNLTPGQTLDLKAYSKDECDGYRLYTIYINLPYYNKYYGDPICQNNKNKLCEKWVNTNNLTYEDFLKQVTVQSEKQQTEKPTDNTIAEYSFLEFLGDYYMIILLCIIGFGSYAIYILDKKNRFDFKV